MGKLYTLDEKLLTETPEIRIKDKVYAVDDRKKTVEKVMNLTKDSEDMATMSEALKLILGEKVTREIDAMDLPFRAYMELFKLVIAAATGEEPDARFQNETK